MSFPEIYFTDEVYNNILKLVGLFGEQSLHNIVGRVPRTRRIIEFNIEKVVYKPSRGLRRFYRLSV